MKRRSGWGFITVSVPLRLRHRIAEQPPCGDIAEPRLPLRANILFRNSIRKKLNFNIVGFKKATIYDTIENTRVKKRVSERVSLGVMHIIRSDPIRSKKPRVSDWIICMTLGETFFYTGIMYYVINYIYFV